MPECRTCEFEATRTIGELQECAACWKYRRRNGRARPTKLVARIADNRANLVQLEAERALWRTNGTLLCPTDDLHDNYLDYPDGTNHEVTR